MFPEFLISKRLESFQQPPCQPPKGKDVLERYFDVLYGQTANQRNGSDAAYAVATELIDLWKRGDARIPCQFVQAVKTAIVDFRETLTVINNKSKRQRPSYQEKVLIIR